MQIIKLTPVRILLLILFLSVLIPYFLCAARQFPVEVNSLWERNFIYAAPVDLEGDSIDELNVIINKNWVQPLSQNLLCLVASRSFEDGTIKPDQSIVGGRDQNSLFVTYVRNDSLFLYDLWPRRKIFVTKGWDIASPKGWDGSGVNVILEDINNDGRLEAIIQVVTGYDLKPRGIFVLDWETGQLLWKYFCGPHIDRINVKDIDGDKKMEILCGTFAPGNGNVENGQDDLHTYVFMLNAEGKVIWCKQIGVYSSTTYAVWLSNKSTETSKILVCEIGSPAGGRQKDSLFIVNALTGEIIIRKQYGLFNRGVGTFLDPKGNQRIVIGGTDDTIRILDENLQILQKKALHCGGIERIITGNFTNHNVNEIVISTTNGKLLLFDTKLKLLSEFVTGAVSKFQIVRTKNKSNLLLQLYKGDFSTWQLLEFNKIPFLSRRISIVSVIFGAIFLLLLFGLGMVYARYNKTHDIRMVIKGLTGKSGVIEINHKGELVSINPRAKEIFSISDKDKKKTLQKLSEIKQLKPVLELAKSMLSDVKMSAPQEMVISLPQEQSYLVRCIRVKKGIIITFEDISAVEYMKRITSWAPVAQKLAHGIKTPLMNIQLSAQQLESACEPIREKTDKIIEGIKSEVKRLKKLTDNFMRFTQFSSLNLVAENINDIINDLCKKYSFSLPQQIKIECNLSTNLPKIMIDIKEIETVLSIIIDNAIEAMIDEQKENKVLSIETSLFERSENNNIKKKYVTVSITDTGKGIPEKYLGEIFEPYFTYGKPEGTGLGLTLAKKIIESHNGTIEIKSKEGIGTQVKVYLPV